MQIIIISPNNTVHTHWHFSPVKLITAGVLALSALLVSFFLVNQWLNKTLISSAEPAQSIYRITPMMDDNAIQSSEVQAYYAKRLGGLQAEAIRLKVLTKKLASMSGLDTTDYLLDSGSPQGGIGNDGSVVTNGDFEFHIAKLENSFNQRSEQLANLQDYLIIKNSIESAIPDGRPIKNGWISSYYGNRIDPFSGKKTFHYGLDFAGRVGSDVYAVADGLVVWSSKRSGYGKMVEIDHSNGYVTRYAHNKALVVTVGDRVEKGQVVALMGSTGRSTGPHVHFEVLRDGKRVNPYKFVKR